LEEQGRDYEAECLRQGYVFNVLLYFFGIHLNRMFSDGLGHGYGYSDNYDYGDGTVTGYSTAIGIITGYGDGAGYGNGDDYGASYIDTLLSFFMIVSRNLL
jgi:hypothetical protein